MTRNIGHGAGCSNSRCRGSCAPGQPCDGRGAADDVDEKLRYFWHVWRMDADLMRCVGCGRAIIASRKNEFMHHAHECPKAGYMDNRNPWAILAELLIASRKKG